jgi:hypothetical protein
MNRGQGDLFLRILILVLAAGHSVTTVACSILGHLNLLHQNRYRLLQEAFL